MRAGKFSAPNSAALLGSTPLLFAKTVSWARSLPPERGGQSQGQLF